MSRKTAITWLLILVALPWPIDYWFTAKRMRQDARDDELVFLYECNYRSACLADFDADRELARFVISPCEGMPWGCFTVLEGDREIFRAPYVITDNTLRTHIAISEATGSPHLLIYDGVSHKSPLRAAFAYNGERLVEVTPTVLEGEVIDAMAAHDETGGWNERVLNGFIRELRFFAYYGLLV